MLITGLRGLLLTSAIGAKFTCTPSARASMPVIRASSRTSRRSSPPAIAPIAHLPRERRRAEDAEADAGFEIRRVEQRHRGQRLQTIDQKRGGERLAKNDRCHRQR